MMVELTLQFTNPFSESIKEIADKRFEGNISAVVLEAVEFYLHSYTQNQEQLKFVVHQIRQEVEALGGFDDKDLEQRIREYRQAKYSCPQ